MVTTGRGIAPWHMWGNTQFITASDDLVTNTPGIEGQLLRIGYGRPETWHWFFMARLVEAPDTIAGEAHTVNVDFNLTIGIGRSQITIPSFETFRWAWGNNANPDVAPKSYVKFSSQALGRVRYDTSTFPAAGAADPWSTQPVPTSSLPNGAVATRSVSNVIDKIVAQDIQLQSVVTVSTLSTITAKVEVSAQFAPAVHIRPEWFIEAFPGNEHAGGI